MSVIPNIHRSRVLDQFSTPANYTTGVKSITIEQDLYQDLNERRELLCKQTITTTGWDGQPISKEIAEWQYDEATKLAMYEHTESWAKLYLPGVNFRVGLTKCEESWKTLWRRPPWLTLGSHYTKAALVIYDLAPTAGDVSVAQARGYQTSGTTNRLLDSARDWRSATSAAAIVEVATEPQGAVWVDPIETVEHIVEEDDLRIIEWDLRCDHLRAGVPEMSGPRVTLKAPFEVQIPLDLTAPILRGFATSAGNSIEVRGGGAEIQKLWPQLITEIVDPERYVIYRRVVTPPTSASADPWGTYDTGTPPGANGKVVLSIGAPTDFDGNAAPALPTSTPIPKPDTPTPPVAEDWQQLTDGANQAESGEEGRLTVLDSDVADGGVYEYRATSAWQTSESAPSNVVQLAAAAGTSSRLGVYARRPKPAGAGVPRGRAIPTPIAGVYGTGPDDGTRNPDSGIIDIVDPSTSGGGIDPDIGETLVLDVPADLTGWPDEGSGDPAWGTEGDGLTDVTTFATEVASRQLDRRGEDAPAQLITISPVACIPFLERGQELALAQCQATIYEAGRKYTITLPARSWRIEEFSWTMSRSGGEVKVDAGDIGCEALP